jgi:hypothetical protein
MLPCAALTNLFQAALQSLALGSAKLCHQREQLFHLLFSNSAEVHRDAAPRILSVLTEVFSAAMSTRTTSSRSGFVLAPVVGADPEAEAVLSLGPRRRSGRFFVASAPVRDLFLCAKHLSVAAIGRAVKLARCNGSTIRPRSRLLLDRSFWPALVGFGSIRASVIIASNSNGSPPAAELGVKQRPPCSPLCARMPIARGSRLTA